MIDTYEQMFGKAPVVATIHAGLECDLLSGQLPELDCVSFGPNMFDVHSVNEKLGSCICAAHVGLSACSLQKIVDKTIHNLKIRKNI